MTERVKGLFVSLDGDYRDERLDEIVNAIKMIKHVQDVTFNIANPDDWINRSRISREFKQKIYDVLEEM